MKSGMGLGMNPMTVDVRVEDNSLMEYEETALAAHIKECFDKAKRVKRDIVERLLENDRQRKGIYDPERQQQIAQTGGSDIYMRITDVKCRSAAAWIRDVINSTGDRMFDLAIAEDPDLPPEIEESIRTLVTVEAEQFLAEGGQLSQDLLRKRLEEVYDTVLEKEREEAKNRANRMGDLIEDQLNQAGFDKAFFDFVEDFVTYPAAIIKGVTVKKKKKLQWGENFEPIVVSETTKVVERVSPYDFFPSPQCRHVNDGFVIQRHRLTAMSLSKMRGVQGYSTQEIDAVLEKYGKKGIRYDDYGDTLRDQLQFSTQYIQTVDESIEALEFWGAVSGEILTQWGLKGLEEREYYEINAWLVGDHVIKAILNPDPMGERPYHIASWRTVPESIWGVALPEQMRDCQIMCNASARAIANNMGLASGPQVEVLVDRLAEGENISSMYPWKIWQTTSDRTGGGQPAVRFFQPQINSGELMQIYQNFSRQADEVTGIPQYTYGGSTGSGAGRTASGLSMLMDNAAKGIKQAIVAIDKCISGVVNQFYVHNMIYHPDDYVKGDFTINCKGATGLLAREAMQVRRNEFLQATANEIDMQIVGVEGRAYILRQVAEGLQMDTDRIVPNEQQLKFKQQQAEQMQLMQQQAQMQQIAMGEQAQQASFAPPGAAAQTLDAAGNPAGGMNTVQPMMGMADGGEIPEENPNGAGVLGADIPVEPVDDVRLAPMPDYANQGGGKESSDFASLLKLLSTASGAPVA